MRWSDFADFLLHKREDIVRTVKVQTPGYWSATYGESDPSSDEIEVIDFDQLVSAIDEFEKELAETGRPTP